VASRDFLATARLSCLWSVTCWHYQQLCARRHRF